MRIPFLLASCMVALCSSAQTISPPADPPTAPDTQDPGDVPLSPAQALGRVRVPAGFEVSLFAGDPDVRQPVACAFDPRGRLWVVECYSYPEWRARDRVLIFEDRDGDGRFDERKVFWDQGRNLTGIELGFGGVWLCSAPHLLFLPDADRDDRPDGPPLVKLDGWNAKESQHNIFNGLCWGPDGWLYGCQGILAESAVARPGTPDDRRVRINCGIWRYHPTRELFEVVAHGTTNPWGLDFDERGEGFFTNCVIGHLWHLVAGARYERMFGQDFNPHAYDLIDAASDHLHWGGGHWTSSRGGEGAHDAAGGGHAHCGAMVYLGDNWPAEYRNGVFTCNIHGRRVNHDRLLRAGSGYVGRHGPDHFASEDPWFRGVALKYGPDGGVYLLDWSDLGECHDIDGVHRTSGRIYKITHGRPPPVRGLNVAGLPDLELVRLQLHANDWFVRHARRELQERAAAGKDLEAAKASLHEIFRQNADPSRKLRALWALHVIGGADDTFLMRLLDHGDETVRGWGVRLLTDGRVPPEGAIHVFTRMAARDGSAHVRLCLASAMQRFPLEARWGLGTALSARGEDAEDHNLPLMVWYGLEPLAGTDPVRAVKLLDQIRIPQIARYVVRRAAHEARGMEAVVASASGAENPSRSRLILEEIVESLRGRVGVPMPGNWPACLDRLTRNADPSVVELAEHVAVLFGDRRVFPALRSLLADRAAPPQRRVRALDLLMTGRDAELPELLLGLLDEGSEVRRPVIRALGAFGHGGIPVALLNRFRRLTPLERQDAIGVLASRPGFAAAMLEAIDRGEVPSVELTAFAVRQMERFGDPRVGELIRKVWGETRPTAPEKVSLIGDYKRLLTPDYLASADLRNGQVLFDRLCASCHMMFNAGNRIGPDLTGSDRANLDYVLENVFDPSATVGNAYKLSIAEMDDGRILSGIIQKETDSAITLQTATELLVLPREEIVELRPSQLSMMPEGLLQGLSDEEIRDLTAYLAMPRPLPAADAPANDRP